MYNFSYQNFGQNPFLASLVQTEHVPILEAPKEPENSETDLLAPLHTDSEKSEAEAQPVLSAKSEPLDDNLETSATSATNDESLKLKIKIPRPTIEESEETPPASTEISKKPKTKMEGINLVSMFATRSSSGRKVKPAAWLTDVVPEDSETGGVFIF